MIWRDMKSKTVSYLQDIRIEDCPETPPKISLTF
jgi:hypothetical protein